MRNGTKFLKSNLLLWPEAFSGGNKSYSVYQLVIMIYVSIYFRADLYFWLTFQPLCWPLYTLPLSGIFAFQTIRENGLGWVDVRVIWLKPTDQLHHRSDRVTVGYNTNSGATSIFCNIQTALILPFYPYYIYTLYVFFIEK